MSYQIGGGAAGPSGQQAPQQMRISTTQTVTVAPSRTTTAPPTLRLRGQVRGQEEREESARRIQWAEDVVDNEGLGRKSSKVCCIYHAPKQNIDDSSSESDSDSSSSDDSDRGADDGSARPVGAGSGAKRGREHKHKHGKDCAKPKRKPSPNAYEKMPKVKPRGGSGGEVEKK